VIKIGLDNGIILHTKNPVENIPQELKGRLNVYFNGNEYQYTICYWRKCWNIRHYVKEIFYCSPEDVDIESMCIEDVKEMWCIINTLNKKKKWEDDSHGGSIWSYKEIRDVLDHDLLCLEWLIYFMRHHNSDEYRVEFYDSY